MRKQRDDCKICLSPKKDMIEDMILKGESNAYISKVIKELGENISYASVNRHKINHMPEQQEKIESLMIPKNNEKFSKGDNPMQICENDLVETAKSYLKDLMPESDLKQVMLNDVLLRQVCIVRVLQERYVKGEVKFPYEQVKALESLNQTMTRYSNAHKPKGNMLVENFGLNISRLLEDM